MMAAQGQGIHQQTGRIRDLHQGNFIARQFGHGCNRVVTDTGMKTIKHNTEIGAIRPLDQIPRLHPILHMQTPSQGLIADPQAAFAGPIRQLCQIMGRAFRIAQGIRTDIGAQAQEIDAQLLHQIEFTFRPLEIALAGRFGHALEITHGLQGDNGQAQIIGHLAHRRRRPVEKGEIIFE